MKTIAPRRRLALIAVPLGWGAISRQKSLPLSREESKPAVPSQRAFRLKEGL
jgi:hypothetical protein